MRIQLAINSAALPMELAGRARGRTYHHGGSLPLTAALIVIAVVVVIFVVVHLLKRRGRS